MAQCWKVVSNPGLTVWEGRDPSSQELPQRLGVGAVVEELELADGFLHFKRLSGTGPSGGWVELCSTAGRELLVRSTVPRPSKVPLADSSRQALAGTGVLWQVVSEENVAVRKGERPTSMKLPGRLPPGLMVEEVQRVGSRLQFLNSSGIGPESGWVSIEEKGKEFMQRMAEPSDPATSFESMKRGFLMDAKAELYPEDPNNQPLGGWAELSKLYDPNPRAAAAAAAETVGRRRRIPKEELPPVDDLEHLDESALVDLLGFDDVTAKEFAGLTRAQKRKMIAEAKALIDMGPEKRLEALENYRKAWPKGPFPELTPSIDEPNLLPAGSCFPYSRHLRQAPSGPVPEWGLECPAGKAVRTFFARKTTAPPEAQKEFLRSLRCDVSSTSDTVRADPDARQPDPCRVAGVVDKDQLAGAIMAKGAARPDDVLKYFNGQLQQRICLLDGSMEARFEQEKLQEADFRGERFKNFKETDAKGAPVSLKGNMDMLVLTKASLVADVHKEFLQAGADIVRTSTYGCNALTQKKYKMNKLVYEMNKAGAQLAKKAAAEVTKAEPAKPRFVAGVIGPTDCMMSLTPSTTWAEMVEAYDEQIKGLVDGGVDLLSLEGITDSLNAKAAVFAIEDFFEKAKRKRMPLMISAQIMEGGRTPSGQSAEAFYISMKHAKPLAMGCSSTMGAGNLMNHFKPLSTLHSGWCSACPSAAGADPDKFAAGVLDSARSLNFVGGGAGVLPAHIAATAKRVKDGRPLPDVVETPYLQLSGLDACLVKPQDGFQVVGSQCTVMGSAKFKKKISAYKATSKKKYLLEAMEVCLDQCQKGADILDFNLDSDLVSGPACPAKGAMSAFMQAVSAEPRISKLPFMLCSCEWDTIKEGLKCVQGKSIVNGITLMLGQQEFLRIAKEAQRLGAAVVVLAITDDGEPAETYEDKVAICQKSYKLLRSKLDFPPEDIIFDCHMLLLGLPEYAARAQNFIKAVGELKRVCPGASFVAGVNNLSLPYRGLNMLRDALHSVFLYHAIPKGLNLAIAWPGALPPYSDINAETRTLCEEMILNRSPDGNHLERFNAFVNFRSDSLACLPVQSPGTSKWTEDEEGNWWRAPAVQKEAKETQKALVAQRKVVSPEQQKLFLRGLSCNVICNAEPLKAGPGAGKPDLCRVEGVVNRDQVANTIVAKAVARSDDLVKYFNTELRKRVCLFSTPGQVGKPMSESDYREYFTAGCDICGTNTLTSGSYEESKGDAQVAKSAAAAVTKSKADQPCFVAGVLGPGLHPLSTPLSSDDPSSRSASWDEVLASYGEQVRGLVDGGVDLLAVEMVSDTLNAKAAICAVDDYFAQSGKPPLPMIITAAIGDGGKTPSGQSIEAFAISVKHAKPLAVGISGALDKAYMQSVARALSGVNLAWCYVCANTGGASGVAELAEAGVANFAGTCGAPASAISSVSGKVKGAKARPLPALPRSPAMQLSGLEAHKPDDGFQMVGQRGNLGGSAKFKGLIDAYKYSKQGKWEAALDLCAEQCSAGADLLDFNFDSELVDSKWAMGKFMRLCATEEKVASVPFVLGSAKWPVIEEGLKCVQGKSIVNAISLVQGEEEFLHLGKACLRYGAAVVVMTVETQDEIPSYQERVRIGQKAYKLLRTKLDFPAEDIIFDCCVHPVTWQEGAKEFIDAVAELKRTCPFVSFVGGVGSLSLPFRSAPLLREALHSAFLYHAIPMGLNMAIVDPGKLPRFTDIEAQTKKHCEEAVTNESTDGNHLDRLDNYGAYLSGSAAEEVSTALVPQYDLPMAITQPKRSSPGFSQPIHTLVQGTGTINASIFQTFGSKAHAALNFHKDLSALTVKRSVWFSSISVWMGQGGSGPITGASSIMDGISLYERWQGFQNIGVAVEWGAIGEIGLRRTIYGSRDVFAQFDLGQKLIGPADTQFLMRAVCVGKADPYEVVGMAYLDQTWQMTLAGVTSGGGLERKTFADN